VVNSKKTMYKLKPLLFLFAVIIFTACKKEKDIQAPPPPPPPVTPTVTLADLHKDTALLYARDIFLWYNQIPTTFDARSYADPDKIMRALRQYSSESGFSQPVDRWSFGVDRQTWDNVSSGISGDFGISVFFYNDNDLRVKLVEKASPAGQAGIKRGWRITKINGSTNIAPSNANVIVNAVWYSNSTNFTFQKPDGSSVDLTLTAKQCQENPIFVDTIYTRGNDKIGYMVFNSFLGDTTAIYNDFQRVFSKFSQAGVTEVAVDLRYNGGGYVSVQDKLANYLVNSSANGNVMMKQEFNNKYSRYNSTTNFQKLGNLNLNRIFFIVSSGSASASELLINNLKPYMNVMLVGPSKTYGKPVGYFPIEIGNWYILPVSFRSVNKNNEGSYFNGFALNHTSMDGLDKDWGDENEASLASILNYISTGAFRSQAAGSQSQSFQEKPEVKAVNKKLDEIDFKGMIDKRQLLK
jgi:C-terminal processing protease CtpA/Prc